MKWLGRIGCAVLVVVFWCAGARGAEPTSQPAVPRTAKVRIVLAGDSTVQASSGWGAAFTRLLSDDVECINYARGGRSSKSFIKEGLWAKCLAAKPDYVLIQFGHNDEPGKAERSTDPQTTYKQYMTQYVDEARAAGIVPVLITSLSRRQFGADGKIHSSLIPYVEVVKEIAAEKKVPLVDLQARSIELYERLGKAECEKELAPRKPSGDVDNTHLTAEGAKVIAPLVADELRKAVPALAVYIKVPTTGE